MTRRTFPLLQKHTCWLAPYLHPVSISNPYKLNTQARKRWTAPSWYQQGSSNCIYLASIISASAGPKDNPLPQRQWNFETTMLELQILLSSHFSPTKYCTLYGGEREGQARIFDGGIFYLICCQTIWGLWLTMLHIFIVLQVCILHIFFMQLVQTLDKLNYYYPHLTAGNILAKREGHEKFVDSWVSSRQRKDSAQRKYRVISLDVEVALKP